MTCWTDDLVRLGACQGAIDWARTQPDLKTAWRVCKRGDWMLWLALRVSGHRESDARKRAVLCACDCAEVKAHLANDDTQMTIAWCLTLTRDWATGGAYSADAADAAYAAAYSAAYAAAYSAAADAAYSAAAYSAAYSAAAAAAADSAAYSAAADAADADIVREHYPQPPEPPEIT